MVTALIVPVQSIFAVLCKVPYCFSKLTTAWSVLDILIRKFYVNFLALLKKWFVFIDFLFFFDGGGSMSVPARIFGKGSMTHSRLCFVSFFLSGNQLTHTNSTF